MGTCQVTTPPGEYTLLQVAACSCLSCRKPPRERERDFVCRYIRIYTYKHAHANLHTGVSKHVYDARISQNARSHANARSRIAPRSSPFLSTNLPG